MEALTFNEFPTKRVIESEWYNESDKQLSFVYYEEKQKTDDGLRNKRMKVVCHFHHTNRSQ